jgi:hypothetical protein
MIYFLHALFIRSEDAVCDMSKLIDFQDATDRRYNLTLHLNDTILQLTIPCLPSTQKRARHELLSAMDDNGLHADWPKVLLLTNSDSMDVPKKYIDWSVARSDM